MSNKFVFNPFTSNFDSTLNGNAVVEYANVAAFPATGSDGDLALALDTKGLYAYDVGSTSWVPVGGSLTVGNLDGQAENAKGAAIASGQIFMQSADATHPGLVNNTTQSLSGNKTFTGTISASNLSNTNSGDVTLTAVGSTPSANGASLSTQALTLQPADGTHPGLITSGTQTIGGAKTFSGAISASNLSGTNTGDNTLGNLTDVGTDGIIVTGGTGAVVGSGTSLAQHVSDATHNGYLSSTDWSTFNGKQASGSYLTALTGDGTASGPGSSTLTLATVNTNTGSFGSSTAIPTITVNGKGLITAASTSAVIAPAGTLSGTTLNSTVVTSSLTSVGTIGTGTWSGTTIAIAKGGTAVTSVTTAPTATAFVGWDANKNISAAGFISGFTTTVTSVTPVTLVVGSNQTQIFTGSTAQTVTLPTTSIVAGADYIIINNSTAAVTVQSSGANTIAVLNANMQGVFSALVATPTTAANWNYNLTPNGQATLPIAYGGTGVASATTAPAATSFAAWDANKNLTANAFIPSFTTTATAAGTTALTIASTETQVFTGVTTQTVTLPTTSVAQGATYTIINQSTGNVTVQSSGANTIVVLAQNQTGTFFAAVATPTTAANWLYSVAATTVGGGSSPLTTKGDLYTHTTVDVRHAVPNDYGTIVADAAQSDGWRNAAYTATNGSPGKNYIQYADFENNATTGWTATGCATVTNGLPASVGTAGAAFSSSNGGRAKNANTNAPAIDSSSAIAGTYCMNLATTGAGAIGDGYISSLYTIDKADQSKILSYKVYYHVATGTPAQTGAATDTYAIAIYDPANNLWLAVSNPFCVTQSTGVGIAQGNFQTLSNTTSVQIFVYSPVAPTATSSLLFDDVYVGPQNLVFGPYIGDWTNSLTFTPASAAFGTITNTDYRTKIVGDTIYVRGTFKAGTTAASTALINLPSGYTIDTTKLSSTASVTSLGYWWNVTTVTGPTNMWSNGLGGVVFYDGSTNNQVFLTINAGTNVFTKVNGTAVLATGSTGSFEFSFPVTGRSSNTTLDSSVRNAPTVQTFTSGSGTYITPAGVKYLRVRMVGGGGGGGCSGNPGGTAGTSGGTTTFGTSLLSAVGGSAGTARGDGGAGGTATLGSGPIGIALGGGAGGGGSESASGVTQDLAGGTGGNTAFGGGGAGAGINGTGTPAVPSANTGAGGGGAADLTPQVTATFSGSGGGGGGFVDAIITNPLATYAWVCGASGTGQIAGTNGFAGANGAAGYIIVEEYYLNSGTVAAEAAVNCKYQNTAGTTVTGSNTTLPFPTKIYDTHNAFNGSTGVYTVPVSGKYEICGHILSTNVSNSTSQNFSFIVLMTSTPEGRSGATDYIALQYGDGASHPRELNGCRTYQMNIGDTLALQVSNSNSVTLDTGTGSNTITITRVGN